MHTEQEPVVTAWYTNLTGQLFKVRMMSYNDEGRVNSIVIEYLDGERQIINHQEWACLKLMKHTTMQPLGRGRGIEEMTI